MRTAILVLGMHRSGTSALTWLLGQAGATLPNDPLPPQRDNPMGFWESRSLVAEHDRLLRLARSAWSDPRPLDLARLKSDELVEAKARIGAAVTAAWLPSPLIAIKDPRICRFAPLFVEVLQGLGLETRIVLALRSPESVVASLQVREEMSAEYARLLWLRHMIDADRASRMLPRVAVDYDALVEDWRSAIPAVSSIIGHEWSPDAKQQASIDAYLKPSLRHHAPIAHNAQGVLPNTADRIWRGLSALTVQDGFEERRELNRACDRFDEKHWLESDVMYAEIRRLRGKISSGWTDLGVATQGALAVHVIARLGMGGPQSSAYIRLLLPLADAAVGDRVRVSLGSWTGAVPDCDVCIVQRAALPDAKAAEALLQGLERRGIPLVVDLDDDFSAMSERQIEAGDYSARLEALDRVLAGSKEVWFSTYQLAARHDEVLDRAVVVRNAIDPKLWRDWRRVCPTEEGGKTRFLYMGTGTHAEDFATIRPHLEALWRQREGQFDVTLIGVADEVVPAPWLNHIHPPADCRAYPSFVAWLREQGPFDIGLAPLADTPFNHAKSDIKLLDYSALGLRSLVSDSPAYRADPAFRSALVADWPTALRDAMDNRGDQHREAATATAHTWLNRTTPHAAVALMDRLESLVARPWDGVTQSRSA